MFNGFALRPKVRGVARAGSALSAGFALRPRLRGVARAGFAVPAGPGLGGADVNQEGSEGDIAPSLSGDVSAIGDTAPGITGPGPGGVGVPGNTAGSIGEFDVAEEAAAGAFRHTTEITIDPETGRITFTLTPPKFDDRGEFAPDPDPDPDPDPPPVNIPPPPDPDDPVDASPDLTDPASPTDPTNPGDSSESP
jgi:hypothetical protein